MDYRKRVCNAMNFINRNLERNLTLDEIAEAAAFSKFHFHRIFKTVVGETVASFTRRLRLEQAANRLLANNREEISIIAFNCGFSSSQNFAKAFRKHYDMSPSQYRKSKQGNKERKEENAITLNYDYPPTIFTQPPMNRGGKTMNAEVRTMPHYNVAYVRKMGQYGADICEQAFGELARWAGPRGLINESATMLAVYWDNPDITPADKCRVDACMTVPTGTQPEDPVAMQTIGGGKYGVCRFEITADGFPKAWEESFTWIINQGYECDEKPCYELYHNDAADHPKNKWIVDICIPLS